MNEEFIKLFAVSSEIDINKIKWKPNIKIEEKITYKNSLVENTIKYPLKESLNSKEKKLRWTKILGTNMINIENANDILKRYDLKIRENILSEDKLGYILSNKNILVIYKDDLVTILEEENNSVYIKESFLKNEELELFPLIYTLNYNLYNLFSLEKKGPIVYFDKKLSEKNEKILTTKSFREALELFSEDESNNIKKLIKSYYKGETLNVDCLKETLKDIEEKITEIVNYRNLYYKEIQKIAEKINAVKFKNISTIKMIQRLEYTLEELKKLKLIEDEKIKQTKIDKFIKNNTEIFIEYSKDNQCDNLQEYIEKMINDIYNDIDTTPKEYEEQLNNRKKILEKDIINTYLIAIYYYLIMVIIKLSDNTLESIYEGNLIKKAIFDIRELEDLIETINRNLLY